jgi:hypothetical protein
MNGLLAGAGVAIAAGSLIALFISESGKLFGFSETGYGTAIVLAIVAEALTVVLLTPVAVVSLRGPASDGGGLNVHRQVERTRVHLISQG